MPKNTAIAKQWNFQTFKSQVSLKAVPSRGHPRLRFSPIAIVEWLQSKTKKCFKSSHEIPTINPKDRTRRLFIIAEEFMALGELISQPLEDN